MWTAHESINYAHCSRHMFPIELTQVDDGIAPVDDLGPVIGCHLNAGCVRAIIRDFVAAIGKIISIGKAYNLAPSWRRESRLSAPSCRRHLYYLMDEMNALGMSCDGLRSRRCRGPGMVVLITSCSSVSNECATFILLYTYVSIRIVILHVSGQA